MVDPLDCSFLHKHSVEAFDAVRVVPIEFFSQQGSDLSARIFAVEDLG
jgi:hypothetical protein